MQKSKFTIACGHMLEFLALICAPSFCQKLYVFHPTPLRPHTIQNQLSDACPGIEVLVFGRYRDFMAQLRIEKPDGILSNPRVLNSVEGFSLALRGVKSGTSLEPFVFLSVGKVIHIKQIATVTVGAVDYLGRTGMDALVHSLFSQTPHLKRVTKVEDLLPLLTFKMANAIMVPQSQIEYFKSKSQLDLVATAIPKAFFGQIALGSADSPEGTTIKNAVKALSPEILAKLGIEKWK